MSEPHGHASIFLAVEISWAKLANTFFHAGSEPETSPEISMDRLVPLSHIIAQLWSLTNRPEEGVVEWFRRQDTAAESVCKPICAARLCF